MNVAAEILEIAHDVKHRIKARRQKKKTSCWLASPGQKRATV
jgi:hypothetical protein